MYQVEPEFTQDQVKSLIEANAKSFRVMVGDTSFLNAMEEYDKHTGLSTNTRDLVKATLAYERDRSPAVTITSQGWMPEMSAEGKAAEELRRIVEYAFDFHPDPALTPKTFGSQEQVVIRRDYIRLLEVSNTRDLTREEARALDYLHQDLATFEPSDAYA